MAHGRQSKRSRSLGRGTNDNGVKEQENFVADDFDMTVLPESNRHLGYPLEGVMPAWGITVHVKDKMIPVAFSKAQALEIARRIRKYYGEE